MTYEQWQEVITELQNKYGSRQIRQGTRRVSFASGTYNPEVETSRGKAKTRTKRKLENQAEIDTYLEKIRVLSLKRKKIKKKQLAELARLS